MDGTGVKALSAQQNQIVILQHAGVRILVGACQTCAVIVQSQEFFVFGHGIEGIKVDLQDIVLHLLLPGSFGSILLCSAGGIIGILTGRLRLAHLEQVQPEGCQQTEPLRSLVRAGGIAVVKVVVRKVAGTADGKTLNCAHLEQHRQQQHKEAGFPASGVKQQLFYPAQQTQHQNGQQQSCQPKNIFPHGQQCLPPEGGDSGTALLQGGYGIQRCKHEIIHHLAAVENSQHRCKQQTQYKVCFAGQKRQQQRRQEGKHSAEAHRIDTVDVQRGKCHQMQQQFKIHNADKPVCRKHPAAFLSLSGRFFSNKCVEFQGFHSSRDICLMLFHGFQGQGILGPVKLRVDTTLVQKLFMASALGNIAVGNGNDPVRVADGA